MKYDRRQNDAGDKMNWIDQQDDNIYDKAQTTSQWWQCVNNKPKNQDEDALGKIFE